MVKIEINMYNIYGRNKISSVNVSKNYERQCHQKVIINHNIIFSGIGITPIGIVLIYRI